MNTIILGVGKIGEKLVESFIKENHDVCVIDRIEDTVNNVINKYDVMGFVGLGFDRKVLSEAGVKTADFFVACTDRDEMNIVCCVLAKKMGAKHTIARIRDPEYFKEKDTLRYDLAIDYVFNPEYYTATEIADILKFPSAIGIESFAEGKVNMVNFHIEEDSPIIGKPIMDLMHELKSEVLIALVERDGKMIIPKGDFIFNADDSIYIIGDEKQVVSFSKKIKIFKRPCKDVFIIGGGKIGYYLARQLVSFGISVKILEKNRERCKELSTLLHGVTVLVGDGTEQDILLEEDIKDFDACVTLTGMDEENVVISLFAKNLKVDKVITKIDRPSVSGMVDSLGLDSVVSPREVIANHVIRFVRAHKSDTVGEVNTFYKIENKVEVLELKTDADATYIGVPLKDLKIKSGVLIGGVIRDDEYIKTGGETVINENDRVIVITTSKGITELSQVLK
ncbi:MAG: Trk system potassium transporter TrkA [Clostridia bacterium]|nr:Trk system potassium transporter TrkA [Clostridia bacterium]